MTSGMCPLCRRLMPVDLSADSTECAKCKAVTDPFTARREFEDYCTEQLTAAESGELSPGKRREIQSLYTYEAPNLRRMKHRRGEGMFLGFFGIPVIVFLIVLIAVLYAARPIEKAKQILCSDITLPLIANMVLNEELEAKEANTRKQAVS